jgi:hypothetical protein
VIRNTGNTSSYTITGGNISADRILNLPVITATDTVATLGLSQTFSGNITVGSGNITHNGTTQTFTAASYTTGTVTIGGPSQTGTIIVGQSTSTQILGIATGASGVGTTKTINFGTGGATGSFTQINIGPGPSAGVGTVVINSGTNLLVGTTTATGTTSQLLQVNSGGYFNGSVGIGTTNPTSALTVNGNAVFTGTGIVTATTFMGSLTGTASTANNVSSTININTSGIITASSFVKSSGTSSQFLKADGSVDSSTYLTTTGSGTALTGIVTSIVAGTGITISGSTGQVTINTTGPVRTITSFIATANQTTFSVAYTIGYIDVYLNGSRLNATEYTASNGTTVVLSPGATLGDAVDMISYGNPTSSYWNVGTGSSIYTLNNVGIGTTNPTTTLSVGGSFTATDIRIQSVAEKTTIVSGNTVSLVYNSGGGNVAICTNPSGDITLNVTGIPTDSTFDNNSLTFSVISNNTGTARSCTTVNLNGLSRTIKWFGGSLTAAISGVTTTSGYDIYNFTGINTVGSASTTANYVVLGSVNGGYR